MSYIGFGLLGVNIWLYNYQPLDDAGRDIHVTTTLGVYKVGSLG